MKKTITITIALLVCITFSIPAFAGWSTTYGNVTEFKNNSGQTTGWATQNGSVTGYSTRNPSTGAINQPGDRPF